jgi:hypothetical protein
MNAKSSLLLVVVSFGILSTACSTATLPAQPRYSQAQLTTEQMGERPTHVLRPAVDIFRVRR